MRLLLYKGIVAIGPEPVGESWSARRVIVAEGAGDDPFPGGVGGGGVLISYMAVAV